MRRAILIFQLIFLLSAAGTSGAHYWSWVPAEVDDPFAEGKCEAKKPRVLQGNMADLYPYYEYRIEWPRLEKEWLWHCPESGYTALGDDFEALANEQREKVGRWLAENYSKPEYPLSVNRRIQLLEQLYLLSGPGLREKADLYILLSSIRGSHWFTEDKFRGKALSLLELLVEELPEGDALNHYLYVAGDFFRKSGREEESRRFLEKALELAWDEEKGGKRGERSHLESLTLLMGGEGRALDYIEKAEEFGWDLDEYINKRTQNRTFNCAAESLKLLEGGY